MKIKNSKSLDRGVFTISLDMELIWGTLDLYGPERFRRSCEQAREAIDRLLELFVEFDVSATWCILGHLFLDRCSPASGRKHPEIVRPSHRWCRGDWFEHDPGGDEASAPTFFGRSLVEKIRACPVRQEIGSHSFSHIIFGDAGCHRAAAASDVEECVRLAAELGLRLRSFAFPRNSVGHLDILRQHGFHCFRGPDRTWYEQAGCPRLIRRLAHLCSVLLALPPPTVLPVRSEGGLWNIPGSMSYFPRHGFRRWIPMKTRIRRAIKGLDAAAKTSRVFHFWFHPMNLGADLGAMLAGLRSILEHASSLRRAHRLDIRPMHALVPSPMSEEPVSPGDSSPEPASLDPVLHSAK